MRKHLYLYTILLLLSSNNSFGQRIWGNPLTQYTYNAAGGALTDLTEITMSYYNTFAAANNNPVGYLVMGTTTFPNDKTAAGFKFQNETAGVLSNTKATGSFMYRIPVATNSKLSFGLSAVLNQTAFMYDRINAQHPEDPILTNAKAGYWGDADFGVTLFEPNIYYVGLGINNLIGGNTNFLVSDFTNRGGRLVHITGLYSLAIMEGDGKIEFSGIGLTYLKTFNYDISTRFVYKKSGWIGTGYRPNAVKMLCGMNFQNFSVGYCGMLGMGESNDFTYKMPAHEIFVKMDLNNSKSSRKNQ